jgi:hypothetical protein
MFGGATTCLSHVGELPRFMGLIGRITGTTDAMRAWK